MKMKLPNVTVTLEADVAKWAKIEAAHQDTSLSRYLGALLKNKMRDQGHINRLAAGLSVALIQMFSCMLSM